MGKIFLPKSVAKVARAAGLRWLVALAVGPALTYGVVGLFIVPFGALGIPWSGWSAIAVFLAVLDITLGTRLVLTRNRRPSRQRRGTPWTELAAAAGVAHVSA